MNSYLRSLTLISGLALFTRVASAQYAPLDALEAVSIVIVDHNRILYTKAPGSTPLSTPHLYTNLAILQLAERHQLDLDAPVSRYIPEFKKPVTLRQLMTHRAGLVHEAPEGKTLRQTVLNLNDTEQIYPPGARTKYSNAGNVVLAYVLERTPNKPAPPPPDPAKLAQALLARTDLETLDFHPTTLEGHKLLQHQESNTELDILPDDGIAVIVTAPKGDSARIADQALRLSLGLKKPAPLPTAWSPYIGEYGPDSNPLTILERAGKLTAFVEQSLDTLEPIAPNTFRFSDTAAYAGEKLTFLPNGLRISGTFYPRRPDPAAPGQTFRLQPVRPPQDLLSEALAANPPEQPTGLRAPELTELIKLDPSIHLDIRYASTNNFMSTPFYTQARAFLQKPAAEAAIRAHEKLKAIGFGLLIHDAYRPWYVTKMFWDGTPPDKHNFVADPSHGSRHNRGCAVDLTLFDLATGKPIEMTGGYDEMSDRSYPNYPGGTSLQRWHRELLRRYMEAEGFTVYEYEWWHFDYKDWEKYPVLNKRFEDL